MRVTVLGCGPSAGVPMIGCDCAVCTSANPRNRRMRASIHIETDSGASILVDTSPDLRQQALNAGLRRVDAVIFTHAHADHCHGIDDLRSFNYLQNAPIPVYAYPEALANIQQRFDYAFQPPIPEYGWFRACLQPHAIHKNGDITIRNDKLTIFEQQHGKHTRTAGIRIGNFAYTTDANFLDDAAFAALEGVENWIVDCLRYEPAPTHAHLALTLEWIARVRPKRAILTHMTHDFDYDALSAALPAGVEPAFDGMIVTFS